MRARHWHVAVGAPHGMPMAVGEYNDPHESIQAFLGISGNLFKNRIGDDALITEQTLNEAIEDEELAIGIGTEGPLMVLWTSCTCDFLPQAN